MYVLDNELDYCDGCQALGDDYFVDETGELLSACFDCPYNSFRWDDDD